MYEAVDIFLGGGIAISLIIALIFHYIEGKTVLDDLVYGSPYQRVMYVFSGMVLALIYVRLKETGISERAWKVIEVIIAALVIIWFFARNTVFSLIRWCCYPIDMVLCSMVILTLAMNVGAISHFFAGRYMVYLGNLSMYLFLVHYPIRMYTDFAVKRYSLQSELMALAEVTVIFGLSLVISAALYSYKQRKHLMGRNGRQM